MINMNKIFLDMDGTLARFNVRNALERFENEKGFVSKKTVSLAELFTLQQKIEF